MTSIGQVSWYIFWGQSEQSLFTDKTNLFRPDKYSMIEIIWYYDTPSYIEEE